MYNFSELSGKIIAKNFEKYGGSAKLYEGPCEMSGFTQIIVPCKIPLFHLENLLNMSLDSLDIPIVTEKWAVEMFCAKKKIETGFFLWKNPESLPPKRKSEEPKPPQKKIRPDLIETSSRNLNFHLTNELEKLKNFYEVINDRGRKIQYGNLIRTLRLLPFKVEKIEQLQNFEGFGEKSLNKIKEILEKGSLTRLHTFNMNERITAMQTLTEIHGIGSAFAYKLFKKGITTYTLLSKFMQENPKIFTETQKIAISLHPEFQLKIPRSEVQEIALAVMKNLENLEKSSKYEICGSFRRQRSYCGDVDLVLSCESEGLLLHLIESCPFITHIFSLSSHKFLGVCKLKDHHRRLDIYCCRPSEFWFAVLYFTGSSNYNRLLRASAGRQNLHLSNTSLIDLRTGRQVLHPQSEEDIIKFLGFPVLSLQERDI
jgi:DNA polymerase lambda